MNNNILVYTIITSPIALLVGYITFKRDTIKVRREIIREKKKARVKRLREQQNNKLLNRCVKNV